MFAHLPILLCFCWSPDSRLQFPLPPLYFLLLHSNFLTSFDDLDLHLLFLDPLFRLCCLQFIGHFRLCFLRLDLDVVSGLLQLEVSLSFRNFCVIKEPEEST